MDGFPILSLVTFLPLLGAGFILTVRGEPEVVARNARSVALWTSLITFFASLFIWFNFDSSTADFQFREDAEWIPAFHITYRMGVDGISLFFILLTTLLVLPSACKRAPSFEVSSLVVTPTEVLAASETDQEEVMRVLLKKRKR